MSTEVKKDHKYLHFAITLAIMLLFVLFHLLEASRHMAWPSSVFLLG